ncbi:MAG: alanine racemase [Acidobacteria bacterium]|jgi:alanine racemase|nr:alanine racemase [Acidobacteriota bacterium]
MKTHITIHAANLLHNLRIFQRITRKPVMFAVKANAYGHGLREVIEITRSSPAVGYFAVDALSEALAVHALQREKPVLVLGWTDKDELEELVARGFETVLPSEEHLKVLQRIATRLKRKALVHLKIETGTNRLGLAPDKAMALLQAMDRSKLEVRGVYSHFANIEDTTDPAFAQRQLELFRSVLPRFASTRVCRHFSSSAASLLFPETHFDMARVGISAYGYWPSRQTHALYLEKNKPGIDLRPVLSWHAKVAQVKQLEKGAAIGYGLTYKTFSRTRIVVVPVGYYDGYDRKLSNASQVLVNGVKAPVRGRICMNMFMVDISHIRNVKAGAPVILLGGEGRERIDADMLAEWSGTINYEVLSRLNPLIPRMVI